MTMLDNYGPYTFRSIVDSDAEFVRRLFNITLRSQMPFDHTGLTEEQIDALLDHQLAAQTLHYSSNYPHAEISIVEHPDEPVARLIIIEFEDEVRLGDLMILPEYQNNGLCSYIMDQYVELGLATKRIVRLHVEKANRAVNLYKRKHFEIIEDLSSHWLMEYKGAGSVESDALRVMR